MGLVEVRLGAPGIEGLGTDYSVWFALFLFVFFCEGADGREGVDLSRPNDAGFRGRGEYREI